MQSKINNESQIQSNINFIDQLNLIPEIDQQLKQLLIDQQQFQKEKFIQQTIESNIPLTLYSLLEHLLNFQDATCGICQTDLYDIKIKPSETISNLNLKSLNKPFLLVAKLHCKHRYHLSCIQFEVFRNKKFQCYQCQQQKKELKNQIQIQNIKQDQSLQNAYQQSLDKYSELIDDKREQFQKEVLNHQISRITNIEQLTLPQFLTRVENEPQGNLHFNENCAICYSNLFDFGDQNLKTVNELKQEHYKQDFELVVTLECQHYFHLNCIEQCVVEEHVQCPVCNKIYGEKYGDQPDGKMTIDINKIECCQGYPDVGTIVIRYNMDSGIRNGKNFKGTFREAYLPNNDEGREVLNLLKLAFERKLIFTVGRSITTQKDNQTVWAGIHHKTNLYGGPSNFGYPDPTYFKRVKDELASKGVFL